MKKVTFSQNNSNATLEEASQEKYYGIQGKTYKQFVTRQEPDTGCFTTKMFNRITRGDMVLGSKYASSLQELLKFHFEAGDKIFEFEKFEDLLFWGAGRTDYQVRPKSLEQNVVSVNDVQLEKFYGALNKMVYKGQKGFITRRDYDCDKFTIVNTQRSTTNGNNWSSEEKHDSLASFMNTWNVHFDFFEFETGQELFKWIAE